MRRKKPIQYTLWFTLYVWKVKLIEWWKYKIQKKEESTEPAELDTTPEITSSEYEN